MDVGRKGEIISKITLSLSENAMLMKVTVTEAFTLCNADGNQMLQMGLYPNQPSLVRFKQTIC